MTIDELNALVESDEIAEFIRVCEARQHKALGLIADTITNLGDVQIVLLAGGSSAGKTTSAKRLCTQLRVNGHAAIHLSTDDYFVGDARNPRDENGEFDYETIECVDRVRLARDLNSLRAGEPTVLRKFDFVKHDGYDAEKPTRLAENGIIVLEGLHALNPLLTEGVDDNAKFRLFIEPSTQPEIFAKFNLPTTAARLIRRLVRDNQFRKMHPLETFRMWPKVLAGEAKWINPFRPLADVEFDSALPYELAVLKPYVSGLLVRVLQKDPHCMPALGLSELFRYIAPTDPTKVPGDSILRETIGSSQLDY